MTPISPAEKNLRRMLPALRLMLGYLPLRMMRWLGQLGGVMLPAGVTRAAITADGVPCEWLIPDGSRVDQVLLYLHGGGFVYGWSNQYRQMVGYLARQMGVRALGVNYRLAPEHPFPAAVDDCASAYRWLLTQGIAPEKIVIAGDSAGGNLTLTTLLKLRDEGDPLPAAAACLSPATDMTVRDESRWLHDPVLHPRAIRLFHATYVTDHDLRDPLLSPVYGDLHGLPPLLIHTGEDEVLRDDAVRMGDALKQAGVEARVEVYPRMWHVWQTSVPALPQAVASLDEIGQFLKAHLGVAAHVSNS